MSRSDRKPNPGEGLRSSFDLAMDRLHAAGGEDEPSLTDKQKERIHEIDRDYHARIAEAEVMLQSKLTGAEPATAEALREEHTRDVARLRERMEAEKARARARDEPSA